MNSRAGAGPQGSGRAVRESEAQQRTAPGTCCRRTWLPGVCSHLVVLATVWMVVASAQGPNPAPLPHDCALVLPLTTNDVVRTSGRCIPFGAVNDAFHEARSRTGPRRPPAANSAAPATDHYVGQLGAAIEETTRLLKERFSLSRADVVLGLADVDTRWTDLGAFCPASLSSHQPCEETRFRRHDGACNNLRNPTWGAARSAFRRLLPPDYADGVGALRASASGRVLPNPRLVSTSVHRQAEKHPVPGFKAAPSGTDGAGRAADRTDDAGLHPRATFMFVTWGQLLDHDLTHTAETKGEGSVDGILAAQLHPNCLGLLLPRGDRLGQCMELARSLAGLRSDCTLGPRAQFNLVTSYIDAGTVYGASYRASDGLRQLRAGLLREQHLGGDHDEEEEEEDSTRRETAMPPKLEYPEDGCIPDPRSPEPCFLAGDNRANEQLGLTALHVLLVREHNRIARGLAALNPHWDDERLFQETRHILAALTQHISFKEFLPMLLGRKAIKKYGLGVLENGHSSSYNDSLDASIPDSFATAAFRFGHSLLPSHLERRDAKHRLVGSLPLFAALQRPFQLRRPGWMDQLLLGMAGQPASQMDKDVTDQVTDHLFQRPSRSFGKDLASINLARAREHGVPSYNHYRQLCNLQPARTWEEMAVATSNHTAELLANLFEQPDDVDLWSAGISEHVSPSLGAMVGPTFRCIIGRTFRNLKLGDRYWYENENQSGSFTGRQLTELRRASLARLICDASVGVLTVQARPMERKHPQRNPYISCSDLTQLPRMSLRPWKEKV